VRLSLSAGVWERRVAWACEVSPWVAETLKVAAMSAMPSGEGEESAGNLRLTPLSTRQARERRCPALQRDATLDDT